MSGQKLCVVCATDVSSAKRIKDPRGSYYCFPCYQLRLQSSASSAPSSHSAAPHATSAPAPLNAPSANTFLGAVPGVRPKLTCPHCWHQFPPDALLRVAQHVELRGDAILGPEAQARFLPNRFNVDGDAL